VPAVGVILEMISALAGVGAVVMHIRGMIYTSGFIAPRAAETDVVSLPVPLLPIEDVEAGPGMEDLPEGFSGFDEDW
jgi:hypothetical protein